MENYPIQNNAMRRHCNDICAEEQEFESSYECLIYMHDEEDLIMGLIRNLKPNARFQKLYLEKRLAISRQLLAYWKARYRRANRIWKNKLRS